MDKALLADEIEQYIFERGGYESRPEDRIRVIDQGCDREKTTENIEKAFNSVKETRPLYDFILSDTPTVNVDIDMQMILLNALTSLYPELEGKSISSRPKEITDD